MPLLFILFLSVPLIELWMLIKVGGFIGAGWTIIVCLLTAAAGAALVRAQGLSTLMRIQRLSEAGETPAVEMFEAAALFVTGAMLLTPGFITDAIGFMLLVPPLRRAIILAILKRYFIVTPGAGPRPGSGPGGRPPLEGDYRRDE